MANIQQHPAAQSSASSSQVSPAGSKSRPPLPDDMTGWLSTHECAQIMGMADRKFRDYAARHQLPKRSVGVPVFYDPEIIAVEVKKRKAREETPRQPAVKSAPPVASVPVPIGDDFHLKALTVLGQIVQDHGRARR